MSTATKIIFLAITFSFILYVQSDVTISYNAMQRDAVYRKVKELQVRSQKLYGNATIVFGGWQEPSDSIRVSKHRNLSEISNQWTNYYECCARTLDRLTTDNTYPAVSVATYQGAPARLSCDLCIAPDERGNVTWSYSKSLSNLNYSELEEDDRIMREGDNAITIYNAREQDGGVYRCGIGDSVGGPVVLEVVDYEENYTVVKPHTSNGPYPAPVSILNDELVTLTVWGPWSACSAGGGAGRRERRGMCCVAAHGEGRHPILFRQLALNDTITHRDETIHLTQADRRLFNLFPSGIFCRSRYLPARLRNATAIQNRTSEIMIGLCKERSKHSIFKLTQSGRVLEEANDTAGVYSLAETIPRPVLLARDIVFANNGDPVILRCPGTVARDIPVTWSVGDKRVVPMILDRESGGRVRVNARGHIVFTAVRDRDDNLYRCVHNTDNIRIMACDTVTWTVGNKRVVPMLLGRESGGRVRVNARGHIVFTAVRDRDDNLYRCVHNTDNIRIVACDTVTWTVGNKRVVPMILDRESGGRVRVNARGHIVFTAVRDRDDNLYKYINNIMIKALRPSPIAEDFSRVLKALFVAASAKS